MRSPLAGIARSWVHVAPRFLPFADAATRGLPLGRLLRLSLFQVSVGMATVLLVGTLNRVMIVEFGVAAWLVALAAGLPLLFAPARALIGFRSDHHRSALGWRRVPFLWMGTLLQFGGLAILPFALLVLSGDAHWPAWVGHIGAALAFLLVGAGMHTTQTAGLALATDLADRDSRPRVVALMYVMLLAGMVASSLLFGALLADFSPLRLIQVIQGAAMVTFGLNLVALWKQETRDPSRFAGVDAPPPFRSAWREFVRRGRTARFLVVVALGTAAFNMQDIVLEPYGAEVLHLGVGATTALTALFAGGALCAFALAARRLSGGTDPIRLCAAGALVGVAAFSAVVLAAPLDSAWLFRAGTALIGFGGGLFAVGSLTAAMEHDGDPAHPGAPGGPRQNGLALGAWGAVQATAAGLAIVAGGSIRDVVSTLASRDALGPALAGPYAGYMFVYHIELGLLFAALVAMGPLVRRTHARAGRSTSRFGLAEFPG
jgi:BCD family chlorophyll transporter-like MFS transporter